MDTPSQLLQVTVPQSVSVPPHLLQGQPPNNCAINMHPLNCLTAAPQPSNTVHPSVVAADPRAPRVHSQASPRAPPAPTPLLRLCTGLECPSPFLHLMELYSAFKDGLPCHSSHGGLILASQVPRQKEWLLYRLAAPLIPSLQALVTPGPGMGTRVSHSAQGQREH